MEETENSWYTLPSCTKKANWLEMFLALIVLIINVIILFGYKVNRNDSEELYIFNSLSATYVIIYSLGFMLCFGYSYLLILRTKMIVQLNWDKLGVTYDRKKKTYKAIPKYMLGMVINIIKWAIVIVQSQDLWCLIPCTIFAFLGMIIHFYFFVFWIIILVIYVDSLKEVVLALWVPKDRIAWTLLLVLCVLYVYSAISFTQYRNDYSQNIPNSCDTMYDCLITIADQWYKSGNLGSFLSNQVPAIQEYSTFHVSWGRFFFDLVFFIIVSTLLVNIVSGIIIDNFGERRSKRDQLAEFQRSRCFICGKIDNDILDFRHHTKYVHNCWDYVYYIGFLKNTQIEQLKDYTDIYVKSMIENNSTEWFPCYYDQSNDSTAASNIQGISSIFDQLQENVKNDNQELRQELKQELKQELEEKLGNHSKKLKQELEEKLGKLDEKIDKLDKKFDKIMVLLSKQK